MRKIGLVVVLALGVGAVASEASAASKEEVAVDKHRYQDAKSRWKDVSKLAEKWIEAHENEEPESKSEIDSTLRRFYRVDLAMIQEAGVEVRLDPPGPEEDWSAEQRELEARLEAIEHAQRTRMQAMSNKPDLEPTKLEALRDLVVPLNVGETEADAKAEALRAYARLLEERYERRLSQYEAAKAES